jgi:Cu(I)/Ag(I) efflux system membrane fusion protein
MSTTEHEEKAPMGAEQEEKPPRGVKGMAVVRWALVALSAAAATWTWSSYVSGQHAQDVAPTASAGPAQKYRCPMHPQMISNEPGECPICHMTLVPLVVAPPPTPPAMSAMPGMSATPGMPSMPGMAMPSAAPPSTPPGTTPITIAFDRVQSIGVRTSIAEERDAGGTLRVTATVAAPEQGVAEVHVRTAGFVDRISVRETGVRVGAGQELLGLYSPDVFQAESELLTAKSFGDQGVRSVDAARQKLSLMGMPPAAIDEVVTTGKAMRVVPVSAPAGGYVTKKNVVLGSYVTPEMTLYEIEDLSRIYILAEVFPRDAATIHVGTEGRFTLSSEPDKTAVAKVDLVYPQIDAEARTTRVRLQLRNDQLKLRPGQYGQVEFALAARKAVVVPRDAIVDTGLSTYVFLDDGGGHYTPRIVTTGHEEGDQVEVITGISAGDRVVSSATFLIDSESRLQASLGQSAGGGPAPPSPCDADFDRAKFPDKWGECQRCEKQHAGMGSMVDDCKNAISKPWR